MSRRGGPGASPVFRFQFLLVLKEDRYAEGERFITELGG